MRRGNGSEPAARAAGERIKASPLARRMARERGIDLSSLRGTGPDGRIVAEDVERAEAEAARPAAAPAAAPSPGGAPSSVGATDSTVTSSPSSPITATVSPTGTSPEATAIFSSTPLASASTSCVALSVSIS